jgi:hypothetical protein
VPLSPTLLQLLTDLREEETTMESLEGVSQRRMSLEIDQLLANQVGVLAANSGDQARPPALRWGLAQCGAHPGPRPPPQGLRVCTCPEDETGNGGVLQRWPLPCLPGDHGLCCAF